MRPDLSEGLAGEEEDELDDVRRLGRVWVRERGTVEIMRWEGDLVDSLFDKLEQQVSGMGGMSGARVADDVCCSRSSMAMMFLMRWLRLTPTLLYPRSALLMAAPIHLPAHTCSTHCHDRMPVCPTPSHPPLLVPPRSLLRPSLSIV